MQHAGRAEAERRGVVPELEAPPAGFDADHLDVVVDHRREDPRRVRPAADARDDDVGQLAGRLEHLPPRLAPDTALELPHHGRERVRPAHRAQDIVCVLDAAHPVAHRVVGGVLERPLPGRHGQHPRAEQLHPQDVELLSADILGAHVDFAVEPEDGRRGGGGHAVLARAGLGDHTGLAHAERQQGLPERVVDLVRPGVVHVLAFEDDPRPAGPLGQTAAEVQFTGSPGDLTPAAVQLGDEGLVAHRRVEFAGQLVQCAHERLGDELPAEWPEVPRPRRRRCLRSLL